MKLEAWITDQVIHDHLTGKLTAGVYSLLADETCWFLAADFDKATWQDDVRAFGRVIQSSPPTALTLAVTETTLQSFPHPIG